MGVGGGGPQVAPTAPFRPMKTGERKAACWILLPMQEGWPLEERMLWCA